MRFETKEAAVFFVDILGMSALTEGIIDLNGIENKIDPSIYKIHVNNNVEFSSPNQIIAAWTLMTFREALGHVLSKYTVQVSQLSDCAFVWSENKTELLLASSELMWNLTILGVLCRGGLSYGEVIIPIDDNETLGSFILGEAVTRAAKHEGKGKGCRVFTDSDSIHHFYSSFPGKTSSPGIATKIYNEIFSAFTNPLDFTITDEFRWYLFHDLKSITNKAIDINRPKLAMYMVGLVSTLRNSPFFAWNAQNKAGLLQLAASIEVISSAIEIHTGRSDAKLSVDYSIQYLGQVNRSHKAVKNFFYPYSTNALTNDTHDELAKKITNEVAEALAIT
ncbi:TPA: hypothetical protein ACSP1Y_004510 [Aeromonas hydrophila]|uniref:hypothetical protein n=1 Tax=Aeromonas hydrophila TaxID=644 RepID=UPI0022B02349|nr:hypothetical protein [Aeromonas hydrophila]MCZ4333356.1 hypothetical protein [Aeromonas hydrophila]